MTEARGRAGSDGGGIVAIIVNYGTAELAVASVESLRAQQDDTGGIEIHLVDNASPGGDAMHLERAATERGWGAQVTLHAERVNHGFGRGNNIVLEQIACRAVPPEFVFLLNPDAQVAPGALAKLRQALLDAPEAGAAGAGQALPDGTSAAGAFRFPSAVAEIVYALALGPVTRATERWRVPLPADHPGGPVDWVSGSALMLRWKALCEIGFFDPGFFLYYEEVDLMRRMRAAGWATLYVPEAQAFHEIGAATTQGRQETSRRRRPDYLYRSWRHYFQRSHGRPAALGIALGVTLASLLELVFSRVTGRRPGTPLHFFADQWRYVLKPLITGRVPPEGAA